MNTKTMTTLGLCVPTALLSYIVAESSARAIDTTSTRTGTGAGAVISSGTSDTATGYNSLNKTTTGSDNTATGRGALFYNVSGSYNTATGSGALYHNTTTYNTATGYQCFSGDSTGQQNTGMGFEAAENTTTGSNNIAIGDFALISNGTGSSNTIIGSGADYSGTSDGNTAVGKSTLGGTVSGSYNTAIGYNAGPSLDISDTVAIGENARPSATGQIILGTTSTSGIGGFKDWINYSDGRFKRNIEENVPGLSFITKLRPVTYNWDLKKLNAFQGFTPRDDEASRALQKANETTRFTGFVAQEVEAAAKQCEYEFSGVVKPANEKSAYALGYAEFVVPLVKAVQEQQKEIDDLHETVASLKASNEGALHAGVLGGSGPAGGAIGAFLAFLYFRRPRRGGATQITS